MNALVGEWRKETDWECLLVGEKKNYSLEEKKKNLEGEKVHFFFEVKNHSLGRKERWEKNLEWRGSGVRALIEAPQQLSDELVTVQLSVGSSIVAP